MTDYFNTRAISASELKAWHKSKAHWAHYLRSEILPSDAMKLGTAVHEVVLLEVAPTEAVERLWPTSRANTIEKHMDTVSEIAAALHGHPTARGLLTGKGKRETPIYWTEANQVACKALPDSLKPVKGGQYVMADLKVTTDASPRGFQRYATTFDAAIQAAHYAAGFQATRKQPLLAFYFVLIERSSPYHIGVYRIDAYTLSVVEAWRQQAIEQIADADPEAEYYAYSDPAINAGIIETIMPDWHLESFYPSEESTK